MSIISYFMERDGISRSDAMRRYIEIKEVVMDCLDSGGSYDDVEEILLEEGLEMDYAMDFI